jgi:hypothetical protein
VSRTLLRFLPVAVLTVALTVAPMPSGAPAVAAEVASAPAVEGDLVARINAARTAAGLTPLRADATLISGARTWSSRMASSGSLSHDTAFRAGSAWAENVGYTTQSAAAATLHTSFMSSAGHRANIMNPQFTAVGVGAVTAGGTTWVTERFAVLDAPTTTTAPASTTTAPTTTATPTATTTPAPEPDLILYPTPPEPEPEPEPDLILYPTPPAAEPQEQAVTVAAQTGPRPAPATSRAAAPAQPAPARQAAKEQAKAQEKAQKEQAKAAEKAAKDAEKAAKEQAKAQEKAAKEQAKAAEKAQKEQAKAARREACAPPPAAEHARAGEDCVPKQGNGHGPQKAAATEKRASGEVKVRGKGRRRR